MKFIAFNSQNGNTSGPKDTKEAAIEWARKTLASNSNLSSIHITAVVAIVERSQPPIVVRDVTHTDLEELLAT